MTARAIGGSEIRYKTVRGYKSEDGMLNGLGLRRWAWSGRDGLDMSELVAAQRCALRRGSCVLRNPPENGQLFLGRLLVGEGLDLSGDEPYSSHERELLNWGTMISQLYQDFPPYFHPPFLGRLRASRV